MADTKNTILTDENITNASSAIQTYIDTCLGEIQKITTEIDSLRAAGFVGDASDGYNAFITQTMTDLKNNFYENEGLMPSLKTWLDSYLEKLLSDVDPNLKSQNESLNTVNQ